MEDDCETGICASYTRGFIEETYVAAATAFLAGGLVISVLVILFSFSSLAGGGSDENESRHSEGRTLLPAFPCGPCTASIQGTLSPASQGLLSTFPDVVTMTGRTRRLAGYIPYGGMGIIS